MNHTESRSFRREAVRQTVIPVYMGLISQIDAHLGRLFAFLNGIDCLDDTLTIVISDNGEMDPEDAREVYQCFRVETPLRPSQGETL